MPGQISHAKDSPQPKKAKDEKPAESAAAAPAAADADSSAEAATESGPLPMPMPTPSRAEVPQGTTAEILRLGRRRQGPCPVRARAEESHERRAPA